MIKHLLKPSARLALIKYNLWKKYSPEKHYFQTYLLHKKYKYFKKLYKTYKNYFNRKIIPKIYTKSIINEVYNKYILKNIFKLFYVNLIYKLNFSLPIKSIIFFNNKIIFKRMIFNNIKNNFRIIPQIYAINYNKQLSISFIIAIKKGLPLIKTYTFSTTSCEMAKPIFYFFKIKNKKYKYMGLYFFIKSIKNINIFLFIKNIKKKYYKSLIYIYKIYSIIKFNFLQYIYLAKQYNFLFYLLGQKIKEKTILLLSIIIYIIFLIYVGLYHSQYYEVNLIYIFLLFFSFLIYFKKYSTHIIKVVLPLHIILIPILLISFSIIKPLRAYKVETVRAIPNNMIETKKMNKYVMPDMQIDFEHTMSNIYIFYKNILYVFNDPILNIILIFMLTILIIVLLNKTNRTFNILEINPDELYTNKIYEQKYFKVLDYVKKNNFKKILYKNYLNTFKIRNQMRLSIFLNYHRIIMEPYMFDTIIKDMRNYHYDHYKRGNTIMEISRHNLKTPDYKLTFKTNLYRKITLADYTKKFKNLKYLNEKLVNFLKKYYKNKDDYNLIVKNKYKRIHVKSFFLQILEFNSNVSQAFDSHIILPYEIDLEDESRMIFDNNIMINNFINFEKIKLSKNNLLLNDKLISVYIANNFGSINKFKKNLINVINKNVYLPWYKNKKIKKPSMRLIKLSIAEKKLNQSSINLPSNKFFRKEDKKNINKRPININLFSKYTLNYKLFLNNYVKNLYTSNIYKMNIENFKYLIRDIPEDFLEEMTLNSESTVFNNKLYNKKFNQLYNRYKLISYHFSNEEFLNFKHIDLPKYKINTRYNPLSQIKPKFYTFVIILFFTLVILNIDIIYSLIYQKFK